MKITSVSYKKIFPIAQFVNETIGIESTVDEGEDPSDVLEKLKEKITMWHLASEIAEQTKQKWDGAKMKMPYIDEPGQWKSVIEKTMMPIVGVDRPHPEEKTIQLSENQDPILRGINEAQSLEELAKFKQAATNSGFGIIYMNKVKELNNGKREV
jgi:hypothetical protein